MKKEISTNKLKEILKTVNTNLVKEIIIKECSNHIPFKLGWVEVQVGSNTYIVSFWDQDEWYVQCNIINFREMIGGMISEFNLNIRIVRLFLIVIVANLVGLKMNLEIIQRKEILIFQTTTYSI